MLSVILFVLSSISTAQVPQGISYQAVARNGQGLPLANLPVKVRFSILDSSAVGPVVYTETHEPVTSAAGLFTVTIGTGDSNPIPFSSIPWEKNYKFLKVELDTTASGNSYDNLGTQQMMSVPYALYARSSGSLDSAGTHVNTASDSTLKLFDGIRLLPGTYTVPVGEKWKIIAINTTSNYGTANRTLNFSTCNTNSLNNMKQCFYATQAIEIFRINTDAYLGNPAMSFAFSWAPNNDCNQCPSSSAFDIPFSGSFIDIGLPIWLQTGDSISFIDHSRIVIEKYRY